VPWLLRGGVVLAGVEVASGRRARRRGLLGREGIDGALLLQPAHSVHTFGMSFPIDVAYCMPCPPAERVNAAADEVGELVASLVVVDTVSMPRHRLGRPRWRTNCVIEAEVGAFERWALRPADQLEIR
jgi:hypothetical protein